MDTPNFLPTESRSAVSKIKWAFIAVVTLVLVGGAGWIIAGTKIPGKVVGVSTSYQAVFLTNGQVYFGKLVDLGEWAQLTDIYYLQVTQPLQQAATSEQSKTAVPTTATTANPQSNIQLVKLGSELHGPEDAMHIEKDKILFWENMKDDSKVVQAIRQYKNK